MRYHYPFLLRVPYGRFLIKRCVVMSEVGLGCVKLSEKRKCRAMTNDASANYVDYAIEYVADRAFAAKAQG